jgi:hypothetical protein
VHDLPALYRNTYSFISPKSSILHM